MIPCAFFQMNFSQITYLHTYLNELCLLDHLQLSCNYIVQV
ncbi:hypothetical protein pb186bvf_016456 [Paramecium bursaria]